MFGKVKSISQQNRRLLKLFAACTFFLLAWLTEAQGISGAQAGPPTQRLADGPTLFKLNCSSSYCHGEQGRGGGAPSLRGSVFELSRVGRVIGSGIPGTAMPAFGSRFSSLEMESLIAYTREISRLPLDETNATSTPQPIPTPSSGSAPGLGERLPVEEVGRPTEMAVGRDLFFDATAIGNCRVCHTFQGQGGKVGPDLSRIGTLSEAEIRESIVNPSAKIVPGYETLQIVMRNGLTFVGVRRDETDERLRLFDTSTMPPISRSIQKAEIVSRDMVAGSAMRVEPGLRVNEVQLRALVAFLRGR